MPRVSIKKNSKN